MLSFSKAIELDSKHVMSHLNRGNCYVQVQDYKSGIDDFSAAIAIDPKNKDAYFNRGAAHYLAGDGQMCPDWRIAVGMGNEKAKGFLEKYCK
ncbi:MAG: tetratricopeptide repeat protein [Bacteroidales bacterium]|nr:tetratricopeptide repeat protein [Bacteroidales bacterium]